VRNKRRGPHPFLEVTRTKFSAGHLLGKGSHVADRIVCVYTATTLALTEAGHKVIPATAAAAKGSNKVDARRFKEPDRPSERPARLLSAAFE
jgi:hypothetical protein